MNDSSHGMHTEPQPGPLSGASGCQGGHLHPAAAIVVTMRMVVCSTISCLDWQSLHQEQLLMVPADIALHV